MHGEFRTLGGGRHAFSLLKAEFAARIFRILDSSECRLSASELDRMTPDIRRTRLDQYLDELHRRGALEARRRPGAGRTVDLSLTAYGRGLVRLQDRICCWFRGSGLPGRPPDLDDRRVARLMQGYAEGWSGTILSLFRRVPMMHSELTAAAIRAGDPDAVGLATPDQVTRRIQWLHECGQLAIIVRRGRAVGYAPTKWSAGGVIPLAYATALELRHRPPGSRDPVPNELMLLFSTAARLMRVDNCRPGEVALSLTSSGQPVFRGAFRVEDGQVVKVSAPPSESPSSTVTVELTELFDSVLDARSPTIRVTGDKIKARRVFSAIESSVLGDAGCHSHSQFS